MPAITWYITSAVVGGSQQELRTAPNFGSDTTTSPAYGWTVGTTASGNYSSPDSAAKRAASSFSATVQPDGTPIVNASGDCWRTALPYTGSFANANWTFQQAVLAVVAGGATGRCGFRLFRSVNASGTSATQITTAIQTGSTVTNLTTSTQQVSSITVTVPGFSVTDEYIFVQIGWEITSNATAGATSDVVMREGPTASLVTSANFTPTPGRQGPNSPALAVSDTGHPLGATDVWVNPIRVIASDNVRAQCTPMAVDPVSEYLLATDFTFTIPSTATIDGIVVQIQKQALSDPSPDVINDFSVLLRKSSGYVGADKADSTPWPFPPANPYATYGGATDKWSTTWTPAEINNSLFGVGISRFGDSSATVDSLMDHVRITVYYTDSATTPVTASASSAPSATLSKLMTAARSMAATLVSAPTLARRLTAARGLAATLASTATLVRQLSAARVLAATELAVATMVRATTRPRAFAATMVGAASLTATRLAAGIPKAMAATMVGAATLTRRLTAARAAIATELAVPALTRRLTAARALAAQAVSLATLTANKTSAGAIGKSLAATAVGVATLSLVKTLAPVPVHLLGPYTMERLQRASGQWVVPH